VIILKNCKSQSARTGEVAEFVVDNTTQIFEARNSEIVVSACEQAFNDVLKMRIQDLGMQEAQ
jgi:hypothetical protein